MDQNPATPVEQAAVRYSALENNHRIMQNLKLIRTLLMQTCMRKTSTYATAVPIYIVVVFVQQQTFPWGYILCSFFFSLFFCEMYLPKYYYKEER